MVTETREPPRFPEGISPTDLARRRGLFVGTYAYDIESSGLPLTEEKSDELRRVISDIALKPPGLRITTQRYNDHFNESMEEAVRLLRDTLNPQEIENRSKFYERIKVFEAYDQLRIRIAYDLAKYSHRGIAREDGSRYFEHVRNTALIIFDEAKLQNNPDLLIAALLHDAVEDATIFGSQKEVSTSDWMEEAGLRLQHIFGPYVSEMVTSVTKPKIDGKTIIDKKDMKEAYLEQLRNASPEAILVKMADRLHNLRTLFARSREDQMKVAKETLEDYLPIFQKGSMEYSAFSDNLLFEIKDLAIQYLSESEEIQVQGVWHERWRAVELNRLLELQIK